MNKPIFHDVQQNTDEWQALRADKITSSNLGKIMANDGKAFGLPAQQYAKEIAVSRLTGKQTMSGFSNWHTKRGHEEEPIAVMLYEQEFFCDVHNGGFYEFDDIGCSPDGRVAHNGLIEVKAHIAHVHYDVVKSKSYESTYKWQFFGNMLYAQKDWLDYISYCGEYPEGKQLYVYRLHADDFLKEFARIQSRVDDFRQLIEDAARTINSIEYYLT